MTPLARLATVGRGSTRKNASKENDRIFFFHKSEAFYFLANMIACLRKAMMLNVQPGSHIPPS